MPPANQPPSQPTKPEQPSTATGAAAGANGANPAEQPDTIPNPKLQQLYSTPAMTGSSAGPKPFTKKLIVIGMVAAVLIMLFAVVPAVLLSSNKKKVAPTESASPSITTRPSVDASARSDIKQRFFLRPPDIKSIAYDIDMQVPTSWEARFSTQPAGSYAWTDTYLLVALLSKFSALSSTNLNTPSNNYLALIDATDWLNTNRGLIPLTPDQKRATVNALSTVTDGGLGSAAGAQSLLLATDPGGRQFIQPIITQDQKLRGITYLTLTKDEEYQPRQIVMLAGSISGRPVILFGNYELRDHYWAELSSLKSIRDHKYESRLQTVLSEFKQNKIADDTKEIADELNIALKNLTLTVAPGQ